MRAVLFVPFLLLALLATSAWKEEAAGPTPVPGGTYTTDATWTASGSPYVVQGGVVFSGATLTIDPGVTVRFVVGTHLRTANGGGMVAEGTEALPIRFTSDATTPAPGDWSYLLLGAGTSGSLDHVTVEFGGRSSNAAVYIDTSNALVDHSVTWPEASPCAGPGCRRLLMT